MNRVYALLRSFCYAGRGIGRAVVQERNLRIHLCAVCFVVLFGIWQELSATHWAIELLCCALVISLELVNTALEAACDALCPEQNSGIGLAKDAAAGAVLAAAIGSVVIWALILSSNDYFGQLRAAFSRGIWAYAAAAIWAVGSVLFVFLPDQNKDKG